MLSTNEVNLKVKGAKEAFLSGRTKSVEFRKQQLRQLYKLLIENKDAFCEALKLDLNKPQFETLVGELNLMVNEILELIDLVDDHVQPQNKEKSIFTFFDSLYVQKEPLGTILVMGAWNYPLLLSLAPLAGAMAAGNTVVMKMPELAPYTGKLIAKLFPSYMDEACYPIINCDLETSKYILEEHKFDQIFYTGGENGGKAVYSAAAKNLTPVVLELGGKSPVYIDDDVCDREAVWNRLFWGKFLNSGQTCIAPDYVLCSKKVQEQAKLFFHKTLDKFYTKGNVTKDSYSRIINEQHFERIKKIIKQSQIVVGGKMDKESLTIEPGIALDVNLDDLIMQEEVFGPVLPFVTCQTPQKAIEIINKRPKPLALYVFSDSKKIQDKFLKETSSGGVCINDTVVQMSAVSIPFGGVGGSGFGKYRGKYSLDVFSNHRSVLGRGFNPLLEWIGSCRYPPYTNGKLSLLTQLGMNRKIWLPGPIMTNCLAFATGIGALYTYQTYSTMF